MNPILKHVDSGLAVFRVGGCSIEAKDCSIKVKDSSIRINHPSIKVCDCFIRVGDCSIRVYRSFPPFLCLHYFSDVSK